MNSKVKSFEMLLDKKKKKAIEVKGKKSGQKVMKNAYFFTFIDF